MLNHLIDLLGAGMISLDEACSQVFDAALCYNPQAMP